MTFFELTIRSDDIMVDWRPSHDMTECPSAVPAVAVVIVEAASAGLAWEMVVQHP